MASRDFLKVSSLIGKLLKSESNDLADVESDKRDTYNFSIKLLNGVEGTYSISLPDFGYLLTIERGLFKNEKFESFIKRFEFELEQTFLRNVVIDVNEDDDREYKIIIEA